MSAPNYPKPTAQPNIDRVLDGFWGVSGLVETFKTLVETAARNAEQGKPRRVRVWVEEED